MEVFLSSIVPKHFTPSELTTLNRCRLYLQFTNLLEIVDGSGQQIPKQARDGHRDRNRPHYHNWPVQLSPGPEQWLLWQKALNRRFPHTEDKILCTPLGSWIESLRDQWQ